MADLSMSEAHDRDYRWKAKMEEARRAVDALREDDQFMHLPLGLRDTLGDATTGLQRECDRIVRAWD